MENLLILPDEILSKILNFLPNRINYAPVCKKFYELICDIDRFKYKLKLGNIRNEPIDRTSIMQTRRMFDSMNVYLEFKTGDDVSLMRDVYQRHGQTVKNLEWSNWSTFVFTEGNIVEMLNLMPNLEELQLAAWNVEFVKPESSAVEPLNLQKLRSLTFEDCNAFLFEFVLKNLPENILKELKIKGMSVSTDDFRKFFEKQPSIEYLNIAGHEYSDASAFKSLKLKKLRCVLTENNSPSTQRAFLKDLIQSQPELTTLDTLSDCDFSFNFVNDEVFTEIAKLLQLETLKLNIDAISPDTITKIEKFKKLKNFELKINRESSLETFSAMSLLKLPIENLTLHLWGFEIPQQTYRQFGENFKLKTLRITLGTWHPISFFIESFPTLESLSIRFGESNNTVELSKVFTGNETIVHEKMKELELKFWGGELVPNEKFLKLLRCFPNLENFKVFSKFQFNPDFFNAVSTSLRKVKSLEIDGIAVEDGETFPGEVVESIKSLAKTLDYCSLSLRYSKSLFLGETEPEQPQNFSFKPLKIAVKDNFKMKETSRSNIRIMKNLVLTSGAKKF